MGYDQVNKRHLEENMALTYRQSDEAYIEKAKKADPIGTIKQMGGREVIKTANGWRAHTKGSAAKTKDHLEKNPSANHKDEHLQKFSKETPAKELQRVIKESTDPRLREHAQKELDRRKGAESGDITKHPQYTKSDYEHFKEKGWDDKKIKERWDEEHSKGEKPVNHTVKDSQAFKDGHSESNKKKSKQDIEHGKKREHLALKEKMDVHEKRGFDEKKGDEDVTGKGEKIPKEDDELIKLKNAYKSLDKKDNPTGRALLSKIQDLEKKDNKFDLKGENPYSKGQKVSYGTEDRFENKWDEHTKIVANHPSGHVLLENGTKMHHTELQKKEHEFKTRKK